MEEIVDDQAVNSSAHYRSMSPWARLPGLQAGGTRLGHDARPCGSIDAGGVVAPLCVDLCVAMLCKTHWQTKTLGILSKLL